MELVMTIISIITSIAAIIISVLGYIQKSPTYKLQNKIIKQKQIQTNNRIRNSLKLFINHLTEYKKYIIEDQKQNIIPINYNILDSIIEEYNNLSDVFKNDFVYIKTRKSHIEDLFIFITTIIPFVNSLKSREFGTDICYVEKAIDTMIELCNNLIKKHK